MIKKLKVMVYVEDPRGVADFWINKIGFTEESINKNETGILAVEVSPKNLSGASIILFDRNIVKSISPELSLGTPSILFMSDDIEEMRDTLMENRVVVGELTDRGGSLSFNFPDIEGNYFAVQQSEK